MREQIQLIAPEIQKLYDNFNAELKGKLLNGFNEIIKRNNRFAASFKLRFEKVTSGETREFQEDFFEAVQLHRTRKKELLGLISKKTESVIVDTYNLFLKSYLEAYPDFSSKLDSKLIRKEKEEKYALKFRGNPILLIRKAYINTKLWFAYKIAAVVNFTRKIFRKPPIDYTKYRKRRIPFRTMVKYYLISQLTEKIIKEFSLLMEGRNKTLLKLWETDQHLDKWFHNQLSQTSAKDDIDPAGKEEIGPPEVKLFDELKQSSDALKMEIQETIDQSIDEVFLEFDGTLLKVDTIDLSAAKFHAREVNRHTSAIEAKFTEELDQWNNSTTTLFDVWGMEIDISLLYYSVVEEHYQLKKKTTDFIANNLSVNFNQLKNYITASQKRLIDSSGPAKQTKEVLLKERKALNMELIDKILTRTIEKLTGSFIEDIDRLQKKTMSLVGNVADKRKFSKNRNYLRGIKDSEISTISPRELLHFEALPHLEEKLEQIKKFVNNHLEKARLNLLSLGTVSDFNLESAKLLLDQKKGTSKKAIEIATEGYERALNHLDTSITIINEIKHEPLENLKVALNTFSVEIQKFSDADNILNLNLKIARIKAVERSKRARRDAIEAVKTLIPKGGQFIKAYYNVVYDYIATLRSRMGISNEKTEISFELSEFIRETESSLKKLPFVYQRLYQLQPTDEDRFFVDRERELGLLTQTYNDWQKERFVSVAILGEKGSGITSFINIFLKSIETDETIIRRTLDKKIFSTDQYLAFFAELLGPEEFESNDEIVKYLDEAEDYKIIIIENMHHMFIKQVGGFESFKLFFDLMANTSKKVLWICAYTQHSWDFLNNTINISDYYIRKIELSPLDDKTIEDIIFRRNLLSGYKIILQSSEGHFENKAFVKMNEEERQPFLRKEFFSNLNKSCNGNISLALLYWLRSTREVSEESITIANLPEIDLSFIKAFSANYLFTLHAILIHDGLTLEDYSNLFNTTPHLARNVLIPMLEKGLFIRPKEKFNINPLIFRQVAQVLRSKNFIN